MRKTGLYGFGTKVNFQWPTAEDLLQMTDIPTKMKDLMYKKSTKYSEFNFHFDAFQVILSNGVSSPVFDPISTNVSSSMLD